MMAGEKRGLVYETIVCLLLEELASKGQIKGDVFWNDTPDGMSIEPDFTCGPDKNHPSFLLMVTHSGSAKESEKKCWRNIGELVEAKTLLASKPKCYGLTFGAIKEDLAPVQHAVFDGFVWITSKPLVRNALPRPWYVNSSWVAALDGFVDGLAKSLPRGEDARKAHVSSAIAMAGRKASGCSDLEKTLLSLLGMSNVNTGYAWTLHAQRSVPAAPAPRNTALRRGLGKLLCIEAQDIQFLGQDGTIKAGMSALSRDTARSIGIASPVVGALRVTDPEVKWVLSHYSNKELQALYAGSPRNDMMAWIEPVQTVAVVPKVLAYLQANWAALTTPQGMYAALQACYLDPCALDRKAIPKGSQWVWLYHYVIELLKLAGGTRTDFGLAALIDELTSAARQQSHRSAVSRLVGAAVEWREASTVGIGLSDWHSRPSGQNFKLYNDDLARVACVLAERLSATKKPSAGDEGALRDAIIQSNLEVKILTYRHFQPLEAVAALACTMSGKPHRTIPYNAFYTWYSQLAISNGNTLDPRSGGLTSLVCGSTYIDWQSCSDAGRDHKKKELCGKVFGARYEYTGGRVRTRTGVQKCLLIVDGSWRQEDFNAMARAGWDDIFFPDEIAAIAKAIV